MTDADRRAAADPETPQAELAELARKDAKLRPLVALNPSAYAALLEWLAALNEPEVTLALSRRNDPLYAQASDPGTSQEMLAALAHEHAYLRSAIAANPSAYPALIEWIAASSGAAAASVAPATAAVVAGSVVATGAWSVKAVAAVVALGLVSVGGVTTLGVASVAVSQSGGVSSSNDGGEAGVATPAIVVEERGYVPTVLILDASGSMVRHLDNGETRMATARAAASTFVDGLADGAEIGLTVFGTTTGNKDSDRAAGCFDVTTVLPVGPVDKDEMKAAIGGITQSGFTPLGPAMRSAADQLAGLEEAQIVIVSDGVDTCSPPPACDVAAELHNANPGLIINAVGFAVDADEAAQEQLACIASAGGGEYVNAEDAPQLAARLRVLSDPVSTAGAITARGMDGLSLGMAEAQVRALYPDLEIGDTVLEITYAECDDADLEFTNGRLSSIIPKQEAPTADGLRVGDDVGFAIALYGASVTGEDDTGTYAQFDTAPGSDTAYRVYYESAGATQLSGPVVRIIICLCGSGGGSVSEMTNWQIGYHGLGPLAVGLTADEIVAVIPSAAGEAASASSQCGVFQLGSNGVGGQISVLTSSVNPGTGAYSYVVRGGGSVADEFLPRTDRGAGVGMATSDLVTLYPEVSLVHSDNGRFWGIATNDLGTSIIFGIEDDRVSYVQVSSIPFTVAEACAF
jgi:hypothetical protein